MNPLPSSQTATPVEPVFEVIDDLVPAELFAGARAVCAGKGWYFGHASHDSDEARFWKMDLDGDKVFDAVWAHVRTRCEALAGTSLRVIRQYANGHTYGLGGKPHLDDNRPGCYTLLYYPMEEWRDGWDGETVFFDGAGEIASAVRPRPNRAVFFDSRILHGGRAPSRNCPALRVTVAYKLEAVTGEPAASDGIRVNETSRDGAYRVYAVHVPSAIVAQRKQDELAGLGQSVRLPGFRPGKIPAAVLEQRYGAKVRTSVVSRLAAEAADSLMRHGGLASKVEVVNGGAAGELEFRIAVTHLPDLPPIDFAGLDLVRLTAQENDVRSLGISAADAAEMLQDHLCQQVLDFLNSVYEFPLAPALVDREFQEIWDSAAAQLQAEGDREEMTAELRGIAERRVRLGAVVAELARRYEIRLTEAEVQAERRATETAAQTRSRLTEARVMDFLVARARVTGRAASVNDLRGFVEG